MEWLKQIRINADKTQEEVAFMAGLSRASYTNIENGARLPSVDVAKKIAAFLKFDWTLFYQDRLQVSKNG